MIRIKLRKRIINFFKGVFNINQTLDILEDLNISLQSPFIDEYIPLWKSIYKGEPPWTNTCDRRLNVSKVICEFISGYNTAELEYSINGKDSPESEMIKQVFDFSGFEENFQKLDERNEATGGGFMKVYNIGPQITIDYVNADCFYPTAWDTKRINEGVFLSTLIKGQNKYTKLEYHHFVHENNSTWLYITNRLFVSDRETDVLGQEVPLDSIEEFATIIPESKFLRDKPLFAHIYPGIVNNKDLYTPLGVSRFANSIDTLQSIDEAFNHLQQERALSKKKIIAPATWFRRHIDDDGDVEIQFDNTTNIYEKVSTLSPETQQPWGWDPNFRIKECVQDINANLNLLCLQTGLSNGSLSFDLQTNAVKTAEEVRSENSKTFRTVGKNQKVLTEAIKDLIEAILFLATNVEEFKTHYNLEPIPEGYEIIVSFDDSIVPDRTSYIKEGRELANDKRISTFTFLTTYLNMTEEDAHAEMKRIAEESPTVPDVFVGIE